MYSWPWNSPSPLSSCIWPRSDLCGNCFYPLLTLCSGAKGLDLLRTKTTFPCFIMKILILFFFIRGPTSLSFLRHCLLKTDIWKRSNVWWIKVKHKNHKFYSWTWQPWWTQMCSITSCQAFKWNSELEAEGSIFSDAQNCIFIFGVKMNFLKNLDSRSINPAPIKEISHFESDPSSTSL